MKAKINGINIDYNFYPVEESPTVVFVHGFPFNQKMWQPQVEVLKGKCSILTYDGRGLGQSEVGDGQFMFENLVDDFIELLRSLKIETVIPLIFAFIFQTKFVFNLSHSQVLNQI